MLALRKRGGGGGGVTPPEEANGIISWGVAKSGKLGQGFHDILVFPYPQGAVGPPANIVQIATGSAVSAALDDQGRVWTVGGNGEAGAAGIGYPKEFVNDWYHVTGLNANGTPLKLYRKESFPFYEDSERSKEPARGPQPDGPNCVALPSRADVIAGRSTWTIAAVGVQGAKVYALTTDGRVLGWGSNNFGSLGVGWQGNVETKLLLKDEEEGKFPSYAPTWAQIAGTAPKPYTWGTPSNDPRFAGVPESQMLKGVKAMAIGGQVNYFLMNTGEIWSVGHGQGQAVTQLYVEKNPESDEIWKVGESEARKPVAIVASVEALLVLRKNGEVVYSGHVLEYSAGSGLEENVKRSVVVPTFSNGSPVTGVVAIAKGEYSCKFLKSDGTVWTCGSNHELQQGFPGRSREEPVQHVTQMPTLSNVVAIDGAAEKNHTPNAEAFSSLAGANGGDGYLYLLSNNTIRATGVGWQYNSGLPTAYEGYGVLGQGTTENSDIPVEPGVGTSIGPLSNIVQLAAGNVTMMVLQQPGAVGPRTLTATLVNPTTVRVDWSTPFDNAIGQLPQFYEEESWNISLKAIEEVAKPLTYTEKVANRDSFGNRIRSVTFTGVTQGKTYEVLVASTTATERPMSIGTPLTLSSAVANGALLSALPVNPLTEALQGGATVRLQSGSHTLTMKIRPVGKVVVGSTSLPIEPLAGATEGTVKMNFAYPKGSTVVVERSVHTAVGGAITFAWDDPGQPTRLTTALTTASPASTLKVESTNEEYGPGQKVEIMSGSHFQVFVMSGRAVVGSTVLSVVAQTPNFAYPVGSIVSRLEPSWIGETRRVVSIPEGGAKPFGLTAALTAGTVARSLTTEPSPEKMAAGQLLNITSGATLLVVEVAAKIAVGATTIAIQPVLVQTTLPIGAQVLGSVREDWKRATPELPGTSRSATVPLPKSLKHEAWVGEEAFTRVSSAYEGYYQKRFTEIEVP